MLEEKLLNWIEKEEKIQLQNEMDLSIPNNFIKTKIKEFAREELRFLKDVIDADNEQDYCEEKQRKLEKILKEG